MSLEEKLSTYLDEFESNVPDVISTNIVKYDGFGIVNTGKKNFDAKKYSAMSAGLHGLSNRTMKQIEGGELVHTYIKGEKTEVIIMSIPSKKLFVSVLTNKDPNIGLILYQLEKLVNDLKEVL